MEKERLNPELVKRLELVADPAYEGEPLNVLDHVSLIVVGLIIPLILMIWGW